MSEGKRAHRRPTRRWEGNVKQLLKKWCGGLDWIRRCRLDPASSFVNTDICVCITLNTEYYRLYFYATTIWHVQVLLFNNFNYAWLFAALYYAQINIGCFQKYIYILQIRYKNQGLVISVPCPCKRWKFYQYPSSSFRENWDFAFAPLVRMSLRNRGRSRTSLRASPDYTQVTSLRQTSGNKTKVASMFHYLCDKTFNIFWLILISYFQHIKLILAALTFLSRL